MFYNDDSTPQFTLATSSFTTDQLSKTDGAVVGVMFPSMST